MAEQGIRSVKSIDEIGDENVIIRSHGVSPDCLKALEGKEVFDLTCPFVPRIHKKVSEAQGKFDILSLIHI